MPTPSPYSVFMSRIQFKANTEKNLITFQQEDLSCENGANFLTRQAGNESAGIFRHLQEQGKTLGMVSNRGDLGVCSVLGMGYRSDVVTVSPPNPAAFP